MSQPLTLDEFNAIWDSHRKETLHPLIYTPKPFKLTKRKTVSEAIKEVKQTEWGVPYEVITQPKVTKEVIDTNRVTDLYKAAGKLIYGIEFKRVSAEGKGRFNPKTKKIMYLKSENAGMADLQGLYKGRLICVEVKRPGEKQLDSQVKFQNWVEQGGGIYLLIHNFTEFQTELNKLLTL
jgi:hypothetical protein